MPPFSFVFFFCFLFFFSSSAASSNYKQQKRSNDTNALLRFRSQVDAHGSLATNWTAWDACTGRWLGVRCASDGRVTGLYLPSLNLRGPVDALSALDQLRILDLHGNRLNGSVMLLSKCANLKLLYLSNNDLSGLIPGEFSSLRRLLRLDLSDNNLAGPIPDGLSKMARLMTLRLQNNALSGKVPDFSAVLPALQEFNVSNNELNGKVPDGLQKKFGELSFLGNSGLCGSSPFPTCSFSDSLPSSPSAQSTVVPSNPSWKPGSAMSMGAMAGKKKGLSTTAIVGIVVADAVVLLVITSFLVAYYCRGTAADGREGEDEEDNGNVKKRSSSYSSSDKKESDEAGDRSKLVFFDRRKHFELEDLLKASAEMLGKGSLGTVYRAILEDGCTVAVKRLKDANPCARKEFEQYMDVIGKMRHPNIVRLRAYYYAKEEKLLVYDYLPNGSFHSLLHGDYLARN